MKKIQRIRLPQSWKTASIVGFGLTAIGLITGIFLISQLLPTILHGQPPIISSVMLALEATVSLILVVTGFASMVAGANPFEDISEEFSFLNSDPHWTLQDNETDVSRSQWTNA